MKSVYQVVKLRNGMQMLVPVKVKEQTDKCKNTNNKAYYPEQNV